MKHFHSVRNVRELSSLVAKAREYDQEPFLHPQKGKGLRLGLVFFNPSLRTRLSTEIAAQNLGLTTIVYSVQKDGWSLEFEDGTVMNGSTTEHVKEAASVLGRYFDILGVRTFPGLTDQEADQQERIWNAFCAYSNIPVISLESATLHPLQSLADLVTIDKDLETKTGRGLFASGSTRPKVVLHWAPHVKPLPHCVANSFTEWALASNAIDLTIAAPPGYALAPHFTDGARLTHDSSEALEGAEYVYVKNWSSYDSYGQTPPVQDDWMLTESKLRHSPDAKIMHCLPVRRNLVLPDELLDGPRSMVIDQAHHRVGAAQAVLAEIIDAL